MRQVTRKSVVLWQVGIPAIIAMWLEPVLSLIIGWGWLVILVLLLWIIWRLYIYVRQVDFVNAIAWTFLQVTIPEEAEQTPKAMENAFDVWDGIEKGPDLIERYFDGYVRSWYSCEIYCVRGRARYILVVPTVHRTFFEGVVYGQYPQAVVTEVDDYTQRYSFEEIDKTIDTYSNEMILVEDDIYPIKSFHTYEDPLSDDDKFIDPHQAMIEAYTSIPDGHEFWIQILIRPTGPAMIKEWAERGEAEIDVLAGKEKKVMLGPIGAAWHFLIQIPADMIKAASEGPLEAGRTNGDRLEFPKVSAADQARADAILRKIDRGGFRTLIRTIYVAPIGQLTKPNIGRLIGGFKQFNMFNANSFAPDKSKKTNQPNYIFKQTRRYRRKRQNFLNYQWRDFWGEEAGYMMSGEELATIYHFPTRYAKAPAIERAKAGVGGAPENIPYSS